MTQSLIICPRLRVPMRRIIFIVRLSTIGEVINLVLHKKKIKYSTVVHITCCIKLDICDVPFFRTSF